MIPTLLLFSILACGETPKEETPAETNDTGTESTAEEYTCGSTPQIPEGGAYPLIVQTAVDEDGVYTGYPLGWHIRENAVVVSCYGNAGLTFTVRWVR